MVLVKITGKVMGGLFVQTRDGTMRVLQARC
jgi:hypothetical protein